MNQLLILCLIITTVLAVSNPEISSKSVKSSSSSTTSQAAQKSQSQRDDALLNSITAYAQQYDSIPSPKPYSINPQIYSQPFIPSTGLKHSHSPELPSTPALETNFQPMTSTHHSGVQQIQHPSPPTPVLMQYLPQTQINDGVQYLQLIPTRPLIVPISPYAMPSTPQAYHQAPAPVIPQALTDYSGRSLFTNAEPERSSNIPYGLQAYAQSLQNYRSYRTNREIKPSNVPDEMALNINEYMPVPDDAPKPAMSMMIRGRP